LPEPEAIVLTPIAIVLQLFTDPSPAPNPIKIEFDEFELPAPAFIPSAVTFELLNMLENGLPALVPTYTLPAASPIDAVNAKITFAETVSIFTNSSRLE
jgi:hypothetical protein